MELLYHYLWKHRLLKKRLLTTRGQEVEVVSVGTHNQNAGPDFSGARIRIDGNEWAGNVEIHVKASDWHAHHHDRDAAYGNVILHVVGINDTEISDGRGGIIPQIEVEFPPTFANLYARLAEKISEVECESFLGELPGLVAVDWLETLAVERMQRKAQGVIDILKFTGGDWERTCFVMLARSFGFSLNNEPFEMLARSLPLNILAHHSDDVFQLEALLFGQAGMLDSSEHIFDEYFQQLCREYYFLARKYGLRPMRRDLWKFSRTRPGNFPTRRIALLARTLSGGFSLMAQLIDRNFDCEHAREIFNWKLDGYWSEMLDFDRPGMRLSSSLSADNIRLLLINFAAPMIYAYGATHADPEMAERGLDIWRDLDPENNSIVRRWQTAGLGCNCATDSQALIQLRKEYCDRNRCLDCRFGHHLLRKSFVHPT